MMLSVYFNIKGPSKPEKEDDREGSTGFLLILALKILVTGSTCVVQLDWHDKASTIKGMLGAFVPGN